MTPTERLMRDRALTETLWFRMLSRVERADTGCWIFTGCATSQGYGCVSAGRKSASITTHRLSVLYRDGVIPDGMTVDHQCHDSQVCRRAVKCVHRRCVNPAHLKVMTIADNTRRKVPPPPPEPQYTADELAARDAERRAFFARYFGDSAA